MVIKRQESRELQRRSMICPRCRKETTFVIDSRDIDLDVIRRRRECSQCLYRFTTYERIEPVKLTVIKKDGISQSYQRSKIVNGILLAVEKCKVTKDQVEEIADAVEQELISLNIHEIPTTKIGSIVLRLLCKVDDVACLRFSSVYKQFTTLKSFEKEMTKLQGKKI